MKLRNVAGMAFRAISDHLIQNFFMLAMFTVSIALFGITVLFVQSYRYDRKSCEKYFSTDLDRVGYFNYHGETSEGEQSFVRAVREVKGVKALGESVSLGSKLPDKIRNIQESHQVEDYADSGYVEVTVITKSMCDICSWGVADEIGEQEQSALEEKNITPLYFGAAYADAVKTGERLHVGDDEYVVAGVLEPKQRWVSEKMNGFGMMPEITSLYNADYMVFARLQSEEAMSTQKYYKLDSSCDVRKVESEMKKIAEQNQVELECYSIDAMLSIMEERNKQAVKLVKELFVMGLIVSFVIMCSLQITSFYTRKKEYGILYVTGMSDRDIFYKSFLENMILFVAAFCVVHLLFYIVLPLYFCDPSWGVLRFFVLDIYYRYTLPYILLLCVVLMILVTGIPQLVFRRISPAQLMRADN